VDEACDDSLASLLLSSHPRSIALRTHVDHN
jgi:hypothetical protein